MSWENLMFVFISTGILLGLRTTFATGEDSLEPFGANPSGAYTNTTFYDSTTSEYVFIYSGNGDSIKYFLPVNDWSIQHGLIKLRVNINDSYDIYPVNWGGSRYRDLSGEILEPWWFATVADILLISHSFVNGKVSLEYQEVYEGVTNNKTIEYCIKGKTIIFHIYSANTSFSGNYAGLNFDRSENTPNPRSIEIPYAIDPIVTFDNQFFYSTYLDRSKSSSVTFQKVTEVYSSTSIYCSSLSLNASDSEGDVTPLDETGYITVGNEAIDMIARPNHEPSNYRDLLNNRVVLDLWCLDLWYRAGSYAVRKWVSPTSANITITGNAHDQDPAGGDGVIVWIFKNREVLWSKKIANGDVTSHDFNLNVFVNVGDAIYFEIDKNFDNYYDATYFDPTIEFNGQLFNAGADFSSMQGYKNWYYQEYFEGTYQNMTWDPVNGRWQGSLGYCILGNTWGHPGMEFKKFKNAKFLLDMFHDFGLTDLIIIYHIWQCYGYDRNMPAHYPANEEMGGSDLFRELIQSATNFGYLFAVHEDYWFSDPEGPLWDAADIAKNADGSWRLGWNTLLNGYPDGHQCYAIASDKMINYAEQQGQFIKSDYAPNAAYLDVNPALNPEDLLHQIDFDASNPNSKSLAQAIQNNKNLFQHQKNLYLGPLFGEGSEGYSRYDSYYAGYVDGVERQIEGKNNAMVIPDFELLGVKPLMANHGMGYLGRYDSIGFSDPANENAYDLYRATEIAYGHAGFLSEGSAQSWFDSLTLDRLLEIFMTEYYMLQKLQSQYLSANAITILYEDAAQMVKLSQALIDGIDFVQAKLYIEYTNGLKIFINHDQANYWTVSLDGNLYHLPPNGWVASNPSLNFLEYSAVLGTQRVDYVTSIAYTFARSRTGNQQTIEDLITDGTVAVKFLYPNNLREIHMVKTSVVEHAQAPYGIINTSDKCNLNLTYLSQYKFKFRIYDINSNISFEITYKDAPSSWRNAAGDLPSPDSGLITVWTVDSQGNLVDSIPWTSPTGKEIRVENIRPNVTYEVILDSTMVWIDDDELETVPEEFSLSQNYPNPFNSETIIHYMLSRRSFVKLVIYNILGEKIKVLISEDQTEGDKTVRWDGMDEKGNSVTSGIYFYRLQAGDFTGTKKMLLLR